LCGRAQSLSTRDRVAAAYPKKRKCVSSAARRPHHRPTPFRIGNKPMTAEESSLYVSAIDHVPNSSAIISGIARLFDSRRSATPSESFEDREGQRPARPRYRHEVASHIFPQAVELAPCRQCPHGFFHLSVAFVQLLAVVVCSTAAKASPCCSRAFHQGLPIGWRNRSRCSEARRVAVYAATIS